MTQPAWPRASRSKNPNVNHIKFAKVHKSLFPFLWIKYYCLRDSSLKSLLPSQLACLTPAGPRTLQSPRPNYDRRHSCTNLLLSLQCQGLTDSLHDDHNFGLRSNANESVFFGSTVCYVMRGTSQSATKYSLSLKKSPTVNTKF